MSKLIFRHGPMNSGKSNLLITAAWNYCENGGRIVVAKPALDTKSEKVVSRNGSEVKVDWHVANDSSFLKLFDNDVAEKGWLDCVFVDEAQFLLPVHVDELLEIAVLRNIPVICYGLRTDFQTHLFPGSKRLFELAHQIEELVTICGAGCRTKARFNARKINGEFVREGEAVAIDGVDAEYVSLCPTHYFQLVGPPKALA